MARPSSNRLLDTIAAQEQRSAKMCLLVAIFKLLGEVFYYILESLFRTFIPVARKSISGQTVLITGEYKINNQWQAHLADV